jgi:hypothetical protein
LITLLDRFTKQDIEKVRTSYAASLSGPLEPYIEELIGYSGAYRLIAWNGQPIGYCCISQKRTLLQFHVCREHISLAEAAFDHLLSQNLVEKALVLTRDPLCLSLSMDFHKSVSVRCHLFTEDGDLPCFSPEFDETVFRIAGPADIPAIRAACGDFHDFLHYTLEGSIERGEIFVLLSGADLLGSGVISGRNSQAPHVDIGMCVGEAHQRHVRFPRPHLQIAVAQPLDSRQRHDEIPDGPGADHKPPHATSLTRRAPRKHCAVVLVYAQNYQCRAAVTL